MTAVFPRHIVRGRGPATLRQVSVAVAFLVAVHVLFGLSPTNLVGGVALGSLYGVIGVAVVLIYRTKRVINFAAAAIGAVPAIVALMLDIVFGVNYLVALPVALVGGPLVGAAVERLVMRRFDRAPRLSVTVVTIGVAQSLAALGFFIPVWFGARGNALPQVSTPWQTFALRNGRGEPVVTGNQLFAVITVLVLCAGLAWFLHHTKMGVAMRACADNADRASLLGIPVPLVSTVCWAIAGLLAAMAIFAQAPLQGVPTNATLGFDTLLYGLAAAVVARMERVGVALCTGVGIGILMYASIARTGSNEVASASMVVIMLAAFLAQGRPAASAVSAGEGTWRSVSFFRPVPPELRSIPAVRRTRYGLGLVGLVTAIGLPFVVDPPNLPALSVLPIYGVVAVSLVILTGWAGQISLGQFGLVGIAAAAAGGLVANHNVDFFAALAVGALAGGLTAVLVGLPAIRIQGLFLAVTTLAFGYALPAYVLNKRYPIGRHLLPSGLSAHLDRPALYGWIDLEHERAFYLVCLCVFLLTVAAALALRRNRSGRLLIGARDNALAATSLAISPVRVRLAAFAISGGLAGIAGTLFAYSQHNVIVGTYGVGASVTVFLAAAIGGLTSVWSAPLSVMGFEAIVLFGPRLYQHFGSTVTAAVPLLISGPLLVAVLYLSPGGLSERVFAARDGLLRRIALRRGLDVPWLVATPEQLDLTSESPLLRTRSPVASSRPELAPVSPALAVAKGVSR